MFGTAYKPAINMLSFLYLICEIRLMGVQTEQKGI